MEIDRITQHRIWLRAVFSGLWSIVSAAVPFVIFTLNRELPLAMAWFICWFAFSNSRLTRLTGEGKEVQPIGESGDETNTS